MSKKYASVADLLSQMQQQWDESPDDEPEQDEDFSISQDMLDNLVWRDPETAPVSSAQVPQANPQDLPSFVTAPQSGTPKEEDFNVPEEMLNELIWDKEKDFPSFLQSKKKPEKVQPQISTEIPEWIPEDWQQDIPSFLQDVPYEEMDAPSFLKKEFPIAKESTINTVDDAQKFLIQLSKTDKEVFKAIGYVQEALEQIEIKGDLKQLADSLGNALGLLNLISIDDDDSKQSISIIIDHLKSEVNKLPEFVQERVNKRFDVATQDKKERRPQTLKSKFLDPGTIFVRQKVIKNMSDEGLSKEDAQDAAQTEWGKIESFVNELTDDSESQESAKNILVQHLLDGEDWDKAAELARKAATSGSETEAIKDRLNNVSFKDEETDAIISDLSDEESVKEDLNEANITNDNLVNQIVQFAYAAEDLKSITDDIEDIMGVSEKDKEDIEDLSLKMSSIANDILFSNPSEIKSIIDSNPGESVIEQVWWIKNKLVSNDFKEESFSENPNISGAELESANLSIENKSKKEIDPNAPPRNRKRKTEKESDKSYRERIKEHGLSDKFYEVRRKYHEKKDDETEEEFHARKADYNNKQFVKKKDYRFTARELDMWKDLAKNPNRLQSKVKAIQAMNLDRTKEFYDRINQVWKYPDDLDKIKQSESLLIRNRLNRYRDLFDELSQDPTADPEALEALSNNINNVSKTFEEARSEKINENKVAEVIYMINSFLKFAQAS